MNIEKSRLDDTGVCAQHLDTISGLLLTQLGGLRDHFGLVQLLHVNSDPKIWNDNPCDSQLANSWGYFPKLIRLSKSFVNIGSAQNRYIQPLFFIEHLLLSGTRQGLF